MVQLWAFTIILIELVCVLGIRLKNVSIPHYGVKDGSVRLGCEFVLESDTLLVLKWYKDEQEFFRYTPSSPQQILTFPAAGVHVDKSQSGLNHVLLQGITLDTTGQYKCEVSAEGSFRTLHGQGSMVVIAPPESDPSISGVHPLVNVGDAIMGNCSSRRSKPAATLMFYVNDEKPEQDIIEYAPSIDDDGLESSFIGFKFLVEPRHFQYGGVMRIKCTATIGNFYWIMTKNVSNANINAQPSYTGHNNRLSSGSESSSSITSIIYRAVIYYCFIIFGFLIL